MKSLSKTTKLLLATITLPLLLPGASLAQTESTIVENGSQELQIESKQQSDWTFPTVEENYDASEFPSEVDSTYDINEENVELDTINSEETWDNKGDRQDFTFTVPVEEF